MAVVHLRVALARKVRVFTHYPLNSIRSPLGGVFKPRCLRPTQLLSRFVVDVHFNPKHILFGTNGVQLTQQTR